MQARPYTLFISDLHLEETEPKITECFLNFLAEQATQAEALYILGDFFEVWIGDDDHNAFNQHIIDALRKAVQQGLKIFIMHGNRDFLLSSRFAAEAGVSLLVDPSVIDLYGKRTIVLHGDSLCTLDTQHQQFRRWAYNPLCQAFMLIFPLFIRRYAAKRIRQYSQQRHTQLSKPITDVTPEAVTQVLAENQAELMIHGHTHRPGIHTMDSSTRIVLGAWHEQGNALFYYADGEYKLKNF